MTRAYGIWWDLINLGAAVFVLAIAFISFALILLAGRVDLLPFQESVWRQFIETVPLQKQSEIGLGVLSVAVSGASAAALYLIRIGTIRWAMNRRIGHIFAYFAEAMTRHCMRLNWAYQESETITESFINSSLNIFEQISETHPKAQIFFEHARLRVPPYGPSWYECWV